MEIWKFNYSIDQFIDGRMSEETQLFSTLDKAFEYIERQYEKKREDFGEYNETYSLDVDLSEWDSESYFISKVKLDEALDRLNEER